MLGSFIFTYEGRASSCFSRPKASHDLLTLGHEVLYGEMEIGKPSPNRSYDLFDICRAAAKVIACGVVADIGGRNQLVDCLELALVEAFFEIAPDDGLVFCY